MKSSLLTMIMVTLVSLFAVGCGDSREDYVFTGTAPGATVGNVTFQFNNDVLTQTVQPVPADTAGLLFTFYNAQNVAFDNPVLVDYADSVTIEGVPALATSAIVTALDAQGNAVGTYRFTFSVRAGQTVPAIPAGAVTPTLATLTLAPTSVNINVGQTAQLTATARLSDGTAPTGGTLVYTSANTTRATVTQAGVVTGVSNGATSVAATYTLNGVSRTATATVVVGNAPTPGNGTLTLQVAGNVTSNVSIVAGQNVAVTVLYTAPGTSNAVPVTAVGTTSNNTVATFAAGAVTGVGAGNATINFSYQGPNAAGNVTAALAVNVIAGNTVTSAQITSVALNTESTLRIPATSGNLYPIIAQVTLANGTTDTIVGAEWNDAATNYGLEVVTGNTTVTATFNAATGQLVTNGTIGNTSVTLQVAATDEEFDSFNLETITFVQAIFFVEADSVAVEEDGTYRVVADLGNGIFQDFTPIHGATITPTGLVTFAGIDPATGVLPGELTGGPTSGIGFIDVGSVIGGLSINGGTSQPRPYEVTGGPN